MGTGQNQLSTVTGGTISLSTINAVYNEPNPVIWRQETPHIHVTEQFGSWRYALRMLNPLVTLIGKIILKTLQRRVMNP